MADDVFETVRTVLAVREYKDQPVPEALVRRIVEAGRLTASSMNGQPWHFVVVQQAQRLRELGALVRTGPYISGAPLAIVVGYDSESRFGVSDASRAIQSMILTAWSEGVGVQLDRLQQPGGGAPLVPPPRQLHRAGGAALRLPQPLCWQGQEEPQAAVRDRVARELRSAVQLVREPGPATWWKRWDSAGQPAAADTPPHRSPPWQNAGPGSALARVASRRPGH